MLRPTPEIDVEPLDGTPRRGLLVASVITLVALPILVLSNLQAAPAAVHVEASVESRDVTTETVSESGAARQLAETSLLLLDDVMAATDEALATVPRPRAFTALVMDPVRIPDVVAAAEPDPTTTLPPTTTPPATAPRTTAAPPTAAPPTTAPPVTAPPTSAPPTTVPPTTVPPTTAAPTATIFGQPYLATWPSLDMWERLSLCESGGNWSINTGNGYYGGLQFSPPSWQWVGGSGSPADASREEQIYRANLLWEKQGWNGWPGCKRHFGWDRWQIRQ